MAIIDRLQGIRRDIRFSAMEQKPYPELLTNLWPKEKPNHPLTRYLSDKDLFNYYLFIDGQSETSYPHSLKSEWDKHFHQFQISDIGLSTGNLDYKEAQNFLYEAINSSEASKLPEIYIFWLDELRKYKDKSLEILNDRNVLARKTLESINNERSPIYKAYLTGLFVDAYGDSMSIDERRNLIKSASQSVEKVLPKPQDLAHTYSRQDVDFSAAITPVNTHSKFQNSFSNLEISYLGFRSIFKL